MSNNVFSVKEIAVQANGELKLTIVPVSSQVGRVAFESLCERVLVFIKSKVGMRRVYTFPQTDRARIFLDLAISPENPGETAQTPSPLSLPSKPNKTQDTPGQSLSNPQFQAIKTELEPFIRLVVRQELINQQRPDGKM